MARDEAGDLATKVLATRMLRTAAAARSKFKAIQRGTYLAGRVVRESYDGYTSEDSPREA